MSPAEAATVQGRSSASSRNGTPATVVGTRSPQPSFPADGATKARRIPLRTTGPP
jgi:hypothetical protein